MAEVAIPLAIGAATTALRFALQPDVPDQVSEGPRLSNTEITTSNYGDPIRKHFGTVRTGGSVIWLKDGRITEVQKVERREVGGKGGGGSTSTTTTYEYFATFAVMLGEGEATGLRRIWANNKVIFDKTTSTSATQKYPGLRIRFYPGSTTQAQDPAIVAEKGAANTPAYRDRCYVVFEDMPLADFGNGLPTISAEISYVTQNASAPFIEAPSGIIVDDLQPTVEGTSGGDAVLDRDRANLFIADDAGNIQRVSTLDMVVQAESVALLDAHDGELGIEPRSGDLVGIWRNSVDSSREYMRFEARTLDRIFNRDKPTGNRSIVNAVGVIKKLINQVSPFDPASALLSLVNLPTGSSEPLLDWATFFVGTDSVPRHHNCRLAGLGQPGSEVTLPRETAPNRLESLDVEAIIADKNGVFWGVGEPAVNSAVVFDGGVLVRLEMTSAKSGMELEVTGFWRLALNESDSSGMVVNSSGAFSDWGKDTRSIGIGYDRESHSIVIASEITADTPNRVLLLIDLATIEDEPEFNYDDPDDLEPGQTVSDHSVLQSALLDTYIDTDGYLDNTTGGYETNLRLALRNGADYDQIVLPHTETTIGLWRWSEISSGPEKVHNISEFNSGAYDQFFETADNDQTGFFFWLGEEGAVICRVQESTGPLVQKWVKLFLDRASATDADLADVVSDICISTDLTADDIDVTELVGETVRGMTLGNNSTARQALFQLSQAYFFDVVESGPKIKFVLRDRAKFKDITNGTTGVVNDQPRDGQEQIEESRVPDEDLPIQAEVTYTEPDLDYQSGHGAYRRPKIPAKTQFARKPSKIRFPIAMDKDTARQVAYVTVYERYAARNQYNTTLGPQYLELDPGDVVDVEVERSDGTTRTLSARVLQSQIGANLIMEVGLESYDRDVYSVTREGSVASGLPAQAIPIALLTEHFILDIPALRTSDIPIDNGATNTVFNVLHALVANQSNWRGGFLLKADDGIAFDPIDAVTTITAWGKVNSPGVTNIVADLDHTTFHSDLPLRLKPVVGESQLANTTQARVTAGADNILLIGKEGAWEIMGFTTVSDLGGGEYEITGLLRGQRGTNYLSEVGHGNSSTFILINPDALLNERFTLDQISENNWYRSDTIAANPHEGFPRPLSYLGNQLKAWPVASLAGTGDISGDYDITWTRRTYGEDETPPGTAVGGEVQLPGFSSSREYEIEIIDPSDGSVTRTFTGITTETVAYTAAQRATDGNNSQDSQFTIKVYQISSYSSIDRGFPKQITVQPFLPPTIVHGQEDRRRMFFAMLLQ